MFTRTWVQLSYSKTQILGTNKGRTFNQFEDLWTGCSLKGLFYLSFTFLLNALLRKDFVTVIQLGNTRNAHKRSPPLHSNGLGKRSLQLLLGARSLLNNANAVHLTERVCLYIPRGKMSFIQVENSPSWTNSYQLP